MQNESSKQTTEPLQDFLLYMVLYRIQTSKIAFIDFKQYIYNISHFSYIYHLIIKTDTYIYFNNMRMDQI